MRSTEVEWRDASDRATRQTVPMPITAPDQILPAIADVTVARSIPDGVGAVGVAVPATGAVPRQVGLSRARLEALGFTGRVGDVLVVPGRNGALVVAVGVGDSPTSKQLRDASAAFARCAGKARSLATSLVDAGSSPAADAAAVVEGAILARYRYAADKRDTSGVTPLEVLTLVVGARANEAAAAGAAKGRVAASAACTARELANTPPNRLTATSIATLAVTLADRHGLGVEVFGKDELAVLGCGGLLGVNAGSTEPPRMVKLTYTPRRPRSHVALVGKGVMYDSGGISIKPTNPMHAIMKMDMSGAAAVLATMCALGELGCRNKVSAWLMCTDNMPSGSAMKLGDVLTIRNGKTVEVQNTDAEGRLILADGLSLAAEETPDVIVDIATLTGAAMAALGQEYAAVIGSDQAVIDGLMASAAATDELLWQLPLARDKYRPLLDSLVADMRNVGGPYAGATTAAIFLSEFVGDIPWAHLDIAGPMNAESDATWRPKGATGFGTRILVDFACNFAAG
jgi:leucyl aminopeptidase